MPAVASGAPAYGAKTPTRKDDIESQSMESFEGRMSTKVRIEKISMLDEKIKALDKERIRLLSLRAEAKYSPLRLDEIGALWNLSSCHGRLQMVQELPEFLKACDARTEEDMRPGSVLYDKIGLLEWEQQTPYSEIDVRPYFERYCLK